MSLNSIPKRQLLALLGLLVLSMVLVLAGEFHSLFTPGKKGLEDQVFFVHEGETLREVAGALEAARLIPQKNVFLLYARAKDYGGKIKAGEYRLSPELSPVMILDALIRGTHLVTHKITIPEGFTRAQIANLLHEQNLADKDTFLALTKDFDIVKSYKISCPDLEGFLFPDTYQLTRGLSTRSVVDILVKRFFKAIDPLREKIQQSGLTMEQVVILASIIEKETGAAEERPVIASVFLNRLKANGKLESDPTVIYGLDNFNGDLTRKDLRTETPYNTYVIDGLPPGAIANPGEDAIRAVLHPARTDYFFFVSKNDGSHHFSKTLSEHSQAVLTYQRSRPSEEKQSIPE